MLNLDQDGGVDLQPVPCSCEDCDEQTREDHGCGFDPRYAGKAKGVPAGGKAEEPYSRTCPQFYLRMPEAQEVYSELKDYKRGALDLAAMPAAYLTLLREAESAEDEWERVQNQQLDSQRKARSKAEAD